MCPISWRWMCPPGKVISNTFHAEVHRNLARSTRTFKLVSEGAFGGKNIFQKLHFMILLLKKFLAEKKNSYFFICSGPRTIRIYEYIFTVVICYLEILRLSEYFFNCSNSVDNIK